MRACIDEARRHRRRAIEVELTPIDPPGPNDAMALLADRDELERAMRRLEPEQRAP